MMTVLLPHPVLRLILSSGHPTNDSSPTSHCRYTLIAISWRGGRRVGLAKNVGGDVSNLAGQYVGPNDLAAHKLIPGYIPRQDWQNVVRQDPLADLLGPMQKSAPQQPALASGF
jgi:hypothetical protein